MLHLCNGKAADVGVSLSELFLIHISQSTCWIGGACRTILCACMRSILGARSGVLCQHKPLALRCAGNSIVQAPCALLEINQAMQFHTQMPHPSGSSKKPVGLVHTIMCTLLPCFMQNGHASHPHTRHRHQHAGQVSPCHDCCVVDAWRACAAVVAMLACSVSIALAWWSDRHHQRLTLGLDSAVCELPGQATLIGTADNMLQSQHADDCHHRNQGGIRVVRPPCTVMTGLSVTTLIYALALCQWDLWASASLRECHHDNQATLHAEDTQTQTSTSMVDSSFVALQIFKPPL